MREIRLNGKQYKLAPGSTIIKRAINPWKAAITSGGREYSSFQNAELEEYHDFRNGIGRKRGVGSEARLDFSEGIDFASAGQTVLGPLVKTAATFGVAPVKIIDFDGSTYAIGHNKIGKWSGSDWVNIKTDFADPIDAIVVTDSTDEYLIVSSATKAIYTTDGSTWTDLPSAYKEEDANSKLTVTYINGVTKATGVDVDRDEDVYLYKDKGANHFDALDIDFELYLASSALRGGRGGIALANTIGSTNDFGGGDIAVVIQEETGPAYHIYLVRGNDADSDTYIGSVDTLYYCTLLRTAGNNSVSVKIYSDASRETLLATLTLAGFGTNKWRYFYGFVNKKDDATGQDFDGYVQTHEAQGYMADYDNRLYFISTDGQIVTYSIAKDIDKYGGTFDLTGNFGTLYDFFEGKLLSNGTPTLYFCGTEGLFTLDAPNQIAYKQEVAYPSLEFAGHKGLYWNANVWVATGYGILKVAPGMATFIGPDQDDGLPSGYQGYIYDMVTVNNWLVFCVNGGSSDKSSILKRNSSLGGNLQVYTDEQSHSTPDTSNPSTASAAIDLPSLKSLINEIKGVYNAHRISTTYHLTVDSTNEITSDDAAGADWDAAKTSIVALVNELKADINAHRSQSGVHIDDSDENTITSDDASTGNFDETESETLANEIKSDYNLNILSAGQSITCLHHSPSSIHAPGRLWFSEGTSVKYMMMPDATSNVKQVSSYEYVDDSGYGKLPIFRKLAVISKTALGVGAITKSCDSDDYIEVRYGLNGADPTTLLLGTFKTSPYDDILTFPSTGGGLGEAFYTIQFAIKLFRNGGNTTSPELESLMFYYLPTPVVINGWIFIVECTDEDAEARIAEFETIKALKTLVVFNPTGDPAKTDFNYNVKLTQMPMRFYVEQQGTRETKGIEVVVEQIFEG